MPRDDELLQLAAQVTDLFGADGMDAATHRALDAVNRLPIDLAEDAKSVPMSVFHDALKAELRRLVQPH